MNQRDSLIAQGYNGKFFTHWMGWFGTSKHRDVGYQSWKPWVVKQQITAMLNEGVEGVIATWSGDLVDFNSHNATVEMCYQCEQAKLGFMLLLNPPMVQYRTDKTITPNQEVLNRLLSTDAMFMLKSSAYYKNYVLEFDMASQGVDVKALQGLSPTLALFSKHTGFTWTEKASSDGKLTAAQNSIATMKRDLLANKIKVAGVARAFFDGSLADASKQTWDATKPSTLIESKAGDFYYQQLDLIPKDTEVVAEISWNDYEEGTEGESRAVIRAGVRLG